ncbi:MAG: hypothetical protein ABII26_03140 [Pseudomonadota bacterium]
MSTSDKSNSRYHGLRLIRGGLQCETRIGSIKIVASPEEIPPFPVDAVAAEEDTFLVLSADPVVREVHEHPVRLMTRLIETESETPGSVLVKGKGPFKFLAIVHDLNQDPTWREAWIAGALSEIFREAENRKLQSIALPLIGTKHGKLERQRFLTLLKRAVDRSSKKYLRRIWLIVTKGTAPHILGLLESELLGEKPF